MVSKLLQMREISSGRREFQQIYSSFHDKIDVAVQSGEQTLIASPATMYVFNSVYQAGLVGPPRVSNCNYKIVDQLQSYSASCPIFLS